MYRTTRPPGGAGNHAKRGMQPHSEATADLHPKLRWLMFARLVFTSFLLAATIFLQYRDKDPTLVPFVAGLYLIIAAVFFLSLLYAVVFRRIRRHALFAFIQIGVDSFIVSLIVFITGGYFSLFSFLYLVVIIYASMILYMRGGLTIALLSSAQFAALVLVQFFGFAQQQPTAVSGAVAMYPTSLEMAYRILITTAACFAVAILSGLLTEQNRKSQRALRAMSSHVKQVEKMAYMGEMAAGLAHEIKNPLASLVGSIQLLKEDLRYDPDHQRLMEIVLRETDRLGTLVNDFLFFARPPAGRPEMLPLREAIEDITGLFEKDANHARRFELKRVLTPDVNVLMDPTHLRQVLWNLLLNAAEAVPDGGFIEIHTVPIKNNAVSVHVKDNGCGIPPEVAQSIFDPFFTTKSEGTGLGLSIVHRILEAYGSRLDVQTQVGGGTTCAFALKRAGKAA
jgi:two-component system, NtrC family, sensor histidine kinase HydH